MILLKMQTFDNSTYMCDTALSMLNIRKEISSSDKGIHWRLAIKSKCNGEILEVFHAKLGTKWDSYVATCIQHSTAVSI